MHSRDAYWAIVEECLIVFHARSPMDAATAVAAARAAAERVGDPIAYHAAPFDVACELAGQALRAEDHWEAYAAIRRRSYGWEHPEHQGT